MSAYICPDSHFIALAVYATTPRYPGNGARVHASQMRHFGGKDMIGREPEAVASYFATVLYRENAHSVNARYSESGGEDRVMNIPYNVLHTARFSILPKMRAVDILKMCDCLEYQSCETDDYRESVAYHLLSSIRASAIRELPGYNDAAWSFDTSALQVAA